MKRLLFLPLLQMPSGHHQVADALIRSLKKREPGISCRKVDFLSYTSEWLEKVVTGTYLRWIHHSPQTYEKAYCTFASSSSNVDHHFQWYERLFLKKMQQMLTRERPDLIVCTHCFPSFLISQLKKRGKLSVPVINVYTDFFINNVWGRDGVDYHFVADEGLKRELNRNGVPSDHVFTTGIPVDDCFKQWRRPRRNTPPYRVLVSGGSNGLGNLGDMLKKLKPSADIRYDILCGNNRKLYNEIASLNNAYIQPFPYIASRVEMNRLYESVDAVITKAGGVTVSEALWKRLPVFVHTSLPGQETFNREYLQSQGLIRNLRDDIPYTEQLTRILSDTFRLNAWFESIEAYHRRLRARASDQLLQFAHLTDMLKREGVKR